MADDYAQWPMDRALSHLKSLYVTRVISPYMRAYVTGYNSYKDTIKKQEESNQKKLDLILSALSLVGGSYLTFVFGKTAVKEIAKDVFINSVCEYNLNRVFKVAAMVEASPVASFIAGSLWDSAASYFTDKTKEKLKEGFVNIQGLYEGVQDPDIIETHLEDFNEGCYQRALEAFTDVENNPNLTAIQKPMAIEQLKASKYFSSLPKSPLNEAALAVDIELAFYMRYVLNLDYLVQFSWEDRGRSMRKVVDSRTAIEEMPSSGKYPTYQPAGGLGMSGGREVQYGSVGNLIAERVDTLYSKKYPGKGFFEDAPDTSRWFDVQTNSQILQRSETTLKKLGEDSLNRIKGL